MLDRTNVETQFNAAGTNKGKDVFTRKEGSEEAEQLHYKQKHVDLEKKFIKAVLQSLIKGGVKVRDQNLSSRLMNFVHN